MNKKIAFLCAIWIVLFFGILFAAVDHDPWDGTAWDVTAPNIDQPIGDHYKEMYDLRKGVAVRMNKEHETLATNSAGGVHKQGSARAFFQDAEPTTQVDTSAFDSGDLGSLWFDTNASPDNQFNVLTATTPTWTPISTEVIAVLLASNRQFAGTLTVDGTTTLTGAVTANGGITLGAGDDLIGSSTSDITIDTTAFTVAGATGNTSVGGTLGVTGASTFTAGITCNGGVTLGAGDDLIGSATSDITINTDKFTVAGDTGNTVIGGTLTATSGVVTLFSAYTANDSDPTAMLIAHAYLATSDGFVYAVSTNADDGDYVYGYIDGTDDPAGAGELMAAIWARTTNNSIGVNFAVASGEYFEITSNAQGAPLIYWRSMGALSAPVDQEAP